MSLLTSNSVSLTVQHIRISMISQYEDTHRDSGQLFEGQGHLDPETKHFFC